PARRASLGTEAHKTALFLGKWLTLAFVLESLMVAYVPASSVVGVLGGEGIRPIVTATLVGVPAYLNGYAALPLVGGLVGQGMAPGAGMAFMVAGGVTSIPAAIAVWALVRPPVFALYLALSLTGAFASGLAFQLLV
ncbi:MAG TPA: permease, partial [Paracoccaceae bacterium]|nr:permease [Paracoccaceae bacterium]